MPQHDVVVLGGGPAGSTAAAILAGEGLDVALVERDDFPRHHVGEALQPAAIQMLDLHLGVADKIAAAGFSVKYGALYEWGQTNERWSVLFDDRLDKDLPFLTPEKIREADYEHSWHVERATFDKILLEEATSRGATVIRAEAKEPLMDGDRVVGLRVQRPDETTEELGARMVLDCSGQRCFMGRRFGLVANHDDLKATACYAYFEGCGGLPGALSRFATLVVSVPEGWVWFIPQSATLTSIGLITTDGTRHDEDSFLEVLRRANIPLDDGRLVEHQGARLRHARNWSYHLEEVHGPGWLATGDAAGFVDPILAGGVEFAVRGACNASIAIAKCLSEDGWDPDRVLAEYARVLVDERTAYLKLARYWYGNNRSVEGFFWEAHKAIPADALSIDTPLRAFQFLSTGKLDADRHYKVFVEWQERKIFERLGVDKQALAAAIREAKAKMIPTAAAS